MSCRKFASNSTISSPTMNLYGQTYDQIVRQAFSGSRKNFQLVYPFQDWTWPTPPRGFIDPRAYGFVGQIPKWSAIGRYDPGTTDMHNTYIQVLSLPNVLGNGVNKEQMMNAQEQVTQARDKLSQEIQIANAAYSSYRKTAPAAMPVQDYESWMVDNRWGSFANAREAYCNALEVLSVIIKQKNPGLKNAIDAATPPYKADQHKAGFANVQVGSMIGHYPNYIFTDPTEWTNRVSAGDGGMSLSIKVSASQSSSALSDAWAGESTSTDINFFEIYDSQGWEKLDLETEDKILNATIDVKAFCHIDVSPDPTWFNSGLLAILAMKNDWNAPYSTKGGDGKKAVFGKHGLFPLTVTGLVVGYQPDIVITMSDPTYTKYKHRFDACNGIRIGPFQVGSGGGHMEDKWSKKSDNMIFKIQSHATYPIIMGITVASPGQE